MKITDQKPSVELSGNMESKTFGIGDAGMIFDILRNKLYSNPIGAICREISCNARDAHREVGKPNLPIQVTLPNALESHFKVKDWGPGISPDRIANIFINYGSSTKRDDNTQTGGFGIGAKVPFSYTDTFTIITVVDGIKYNYACVIDETKAGKLMLLNETKTQEPNGTEICVPVKAIDRSVFVREMIESSQYWDIKPVLKGATGIEYREIVKLFEGDGWYFEKLNRNGDHIKVNIDGVIYSVSANVILFDDKKLNNDNDNYYSRQNSYDNEDYNFIMNLNSQMVLTFNIGELSISANRETLYIDDKTKNKVKERIRLAKSEMIKEVEKLLSDCTTLWEAEHKFSKVIRPSFHNSAFLKNVKWRDIKLSHDFVHGFPLQVIKFDRDAFEKTKAGTSKLNKVINHLLSFDKDTKVALCDFPDSSLIKVNTVRHLFDDDKTLQSVQIILPKDNYGEAELIKKTNYAHWGVVKLSTLVKEPKAAKEYNGIKFILYKFDPSSGRFSQTSQDACEKDANKKVLCRVVKTYGSGVTAAKYGSKPVQLYEMAHLQSHFKGVSFYAAEKDVKEEKVKKLVVDKTLDEFVKEEVLPLLKEDVLLRDQVLGMAFNRRDYGLHDLITPKNAEKIESPTSPALKIFDIFAKSAISNSNPALYAFYQIFLGKTFSNNEINAFLNKNPELNMELVQAEFYKAYPLFKLLRYNQYDRSSSMAEAAMEYINLIDKKDKK